MLLVGGIGSDLTYEVFDADRPGGYGVYDNSGAALSAAREQPGVAASADAVWIFGGGRVTSNDDLAEIWSPMPPPNGSVNPASDTEFPSSMAGMGEDHPEYALTRPNVTPINGGAQILVTGWLGPSCTVGSDTVIFAEGTREICDAPSAGSRSFITDTMTGVTQPIDLGGLHAFAGSTVMEELSLNPYLPDFEDAPPVVVSGGIADGTLTTTNQVRVVNAASAATPTPQVTTASLAAGRLYHTTTALPHRGLLTLGGLQFRGTNQITLPQAVEVHYLAAPGPPRQEPQ